MGGRVGSGGGVGWGESCDEWRESTERVRSTIIILIIYNVHILFLYWYYENSDYNNIDRNWVITR